MTEVEEHKPVEAEQVTPKRRQRKRRASISAEVDNVAPADFIPKVIEKTESEIERISKAVGTNFLFSNLDEEQQKQVFGAMEEKRVPNGTEIIKQGDSGDYFYVLDDGSADVLVDSEKVLSYSSGSAFGELALMYNTPRAATVVATSDCTLWALDRQTFRHILFANQSKKVNGYETFLKQCDLFKGLTDLEITKVADVLEEQRFKKGDVILTQGDEDYNNMKFYLVVKGEVVATQKSETGEDLVVGSSTTGGFFGEKALIEKVPRAATVSASTDLTCACLDVAAFERLLGPCRDTMKRQINTYSAVSETAQGSAINAVRALTPTSGRLLERANSESSDINDHVQNVSLENSSPDIQSADPSDQN